MSQTGGATAGESQQITGRAAAGPCSDVSAAGGELLVAGALITFGSGWQPVARRGLPGAQVALLERQHGEPQLANARSGWLAFTVRQTGWTDVHTVSPDGRALHYIVSVTDDGIKTVDPAAPPAAP